MMLASPFTRTTTKKLLLLTESRIFQCPKYNLLHALVLLFFAVSLISSEPHPERCLKNLPERSYKRFLYINKIQRDINIEVSTRTSHQLVSSIARIIIKEVLNYDRVHFVKNSEYKNEYTFCSMPDFEAHPYSVINLEAWLPVTYNFDDVKKYFHTISLGPLGALGRFGLYIPTSLVDAMWENYSATIQCGQSLKKPDMRSIFISTEMYKEVKEIIHKNYKNSSVLCESFTNCTDGVYHSSERCSLDPGSCPILVSSYFSVYGSCLVELIKRLELDLTVMWIGDHLINYVLQKTENGIPVMYFGWNLDLLSATGKFSPICIPDNLCEIGKNPVVNNCDWQIRPIHKVAWNDLKILAPEIHHTLIKMELHNYDLADLLKSYYDFSHFDGLRVSTNNEERYIEQTACEWVKKNELKWITWIPQGLVNKTPIYIGGLFSFSGRNLRDYGVVAASLMAAEYINNDPNILPNHHIQVLVVDTASRLDLIMTGLNEYVTNVTHKVAGLLDTVMPEAEEMVAGLSTIFKTPLIGYNSRSVRLSKRNLYPYFFRINSIFIDKWYVLLDMFELFKWKQVALFLEDAPALDGYHSFFKDQFVSRSIHVAYDFKLPKIKELSDLSENLDLLKKKRINVIVAAIENKNMISFLCQIYDKKMLSINNFSWLFITSLVDKWWIIGKALPRSKFYNFVHEECTQSKVTEALQSHFVFHNSFAYSPSDRIVGNKTVDQWVQDFNEKVSLHPQFKNLSMSALTTRAFDSVLVYAKAFHQLLLEDPSALLSIHDDDTLKRFVNIVESLQFNGLTGPIKFKEADRSSVIEILQMQTDEFRTVGYFRPEGMNSSSSPLEMFEDKLTWRTPSGKPPNDAPDDEKACSVETIRVLLGVECDYAIIFINVTVFGIFIFPVIIFVIYIKRRYDDKLAIMSKETPQIIGWELNRSEIILNRRIGQGEFGTVFGGEAKINQIWVAVAVKTLKPGSTSVDKVDFFREAGLMKDFSHENIVKLLGVCTVGDPALVVMEFMLHGDLRSYLLSRRHLVNETSEEAMDVNPQAITKMALDVACGLKYLTNLGFVHRDLACRNCLVHETGVIKIGDFGLTENIYSNGYVRCVSNGKFPVRWMAPESLREGVFSAASDIWSFGVLIYEIFTFGALPYHGLANEQVVVFIKNHKTLELPAGCPDNLEKLLKECWAYENDKRPTIDVIIDQLERMPLLLLPCLDVPRPQVGLDGVGGNNGLIVNFIDPARPPRSSGMTKHKAYLSGMPLLNNGRQMKLMTSRGPEKSPDVCSPHSMSANCFDFPTPTGEKRFDLIKASEMQRTRKEDCGEESRDVALGYSLRNSDEVGNETKALLCNGCERSSTAPILHRSISTEPKFKKCPDSKGNPVITTEVSSRTCKTSSGPLNYVDHQQNKQHHSRKKNSNISSSPAL